MSNKNLCDNCRFLSELTTENCQPTDYDQLGNVLRCDTYQEKSAMRCIMNIIWKIKKD
jgi:hypothetical protein